MRRDRVFITNIHEKMSLIGYKVLVCSNPVRLFSYDVQSTEQFKKFRGRFTDAKPIAWKKHDVMDYHNKRSFSDCVVALDEDEIRRDILDMADSDSEAESNDGEIFDRFEYEGTATSTNILTTSDHEQGWRLFKLLVKVDNFIDINLGTSPLSFWIESFGPTTETHRYGWNIAEHLLIESNDTVFLDLDESMGKLDQAWLHRPSTEHVMEFLLVVDHDEKVLRFGCSNALFGYSVPFEPNQWYRIRARYGKACEALMLVEVFNKPPALQQLCSQFILNMYEEQWREKFGLQCNDENNFCMSLVDRYYFELCNADKDREVDTRLKARKSLVEAFKLTYETNSTLH